MDANKFLRNLLDDQEVKDDSKEMKALLEERQKVEKLIFKHFPDEKPDIHLGGSLAKETMVLDSYDLDLPTYFGTNQRKDKSLEENFNDLATCLETEYYVERKKSALRLKKKGAQKDHEDFRIDVVPGRYTDETKTDAYLYVNDATEKERLKTNLKTHIKHVRDSGYTDEIRLLKIWKVRNKTDVKTFILELLVIKILKDDKFNEGLEKNLKHVWEVIRDKVDDLVLEDPANPSGNDLSKIFNTAMKAEIKAAAKSALSKIDKENGWYLVFNEKVPAKTSSAAYVSPSVLQVKPYGTTKRWDK